MGRRKERGGRRQVLQLDDSKRDDSPYRGHGGSQWPARNEGNANALSGLMAHYGESDESDQDDAPTPPHCPPPAPETNAAEIAEPEEKAVSPKPAAKENGVKLKNGNMSMDIDDKVANFLAEIDALDADSNDIDGEPLEETNQDAVGEEEVSSLPPPVQSATEPADTPSENGSAESQEESDTEDDEAPQAPIAPVSVWHHCQDENTQYYYYWNTATNEVTWEIPMEYSQQLLLLKEYDESLARYQKQKAEYEEKKKKRPKKKKREKTPKETQKKLPSEEAPEAAVTEEEQAPLATAEKKPTKSWFLKKIRETYGDRYDKTSSDSAEDSDTAPSHSDEIGPRLPHSAIGPQLPTSKIEPQSPEIEIGPQLPSHLQIGPQLPSSEIGPQLPSSEIGPQLPDRTLHKEPLNEIGPQLPSQEDSSASIIGPQMPSSMSFGSVPPPKDLYSSGDQSREVSSERESVSDRIKEEEIQDADSSSYGATGDVTRLKNLTAYDSGNEADTTNDSNGTAVLPLNVGINDEPLQFTERTGSEDEEEFDLDFIDKQLEESLDSRYSKKKKPSKELEAKPSSKTDVKVKSEPKVELKAEVKDEDSDMEFDFDDIDQELEAALEKRKAEDKKPSKKEATPSKRKLADSGPEEKAKRTKSGDEEKTQPKKKIDKEEIKTKAEVMDLQTLITDKLEFLEVTRKGLSKLQVLLIEIQTRIKDWKEGGLNSQYLLGRLEDAEQQLKQYETSAAPSGWACHWDRSYKRYFYFHLTTGASQWDYPEEDGNKDVTKSDAHSTAIEPSPPNDKSQTALVSSSQVDGERDDGNGKAPLPQCAQVDSTTAMATDSGPSPTANVSSSVSSSFTAKTEPTSSSVGESSSSSGASSAFAVDPSLFQDLFAPAPPPPAEPPPPGVEAAAQSSVAPPRPPPGLPAASLQLSRSPPPPPPGTTPPPSAIEDIEMEIDPATSSLLAAAPPPPPPPPLDTATTVNSYPAAPPVVEQPPQYQMVAPLPVPPVIMASPYISHNTVTGMPMPVPMPVSVPPVAQVTSSQSTIVAAPVISSVAQQNSSSTSVVAPPSQPPTATTPDTPPPTPVQYDPTLDGVPMVDSSHSSQQSSSLSSTSSSTLSSSSSSIAAAAVAAAQAKEKKRKKEKKSAMGLSLKKKKLPSLVAKWQEVQEMVEREASKHAKEEESP